MNAKLIHDDDQRTFVLIFDPDDEVLAGLRAFAVEQNLAASDFTAIGAFQSATLGFFDLDRKDYERIPIDEQVEVLSLIGNVARHGDWEKVHAHVVVAKRDGTAHGGHLLEGIVRPTLEVVLTESPSHLQRVTDKATGLPLIAIGDN